jgi:PhnB protein
MPVKAIPDGYTSITPYLVCKGAAQAIEFYAKAFGAEETVRMPGPGGKIMHAEIRIGNAIVMLADENPERGALSPQTIGGAGVSIMLYTENVDAVHSAAVNAGAKSTSAPEDMFWGDRMGTVTDPFGHSWAIATHKEDVSPEEMGKRMAAIGS